MKLAEVRNTLTTYIWTLSCPDKLLLNASYAN